VQSDKAQVDLPSDTAVRIVRTFKAPRELVWRAHTEPALIQRWMLGPPGWSMPVCEMDVRVGGAYLWRWRNNEDGKQFGFHGEFTEVSPHSRLTHTEFYDPGDVGGDMGAGSQVLNELSEKDGVTTQAVLITYRSKAERDAALSTGMTDGMEMSYQRLDVLFAEA